MPNVWAFLVVILSIVVDFSRSRALKRAADKYSSQALEADALHFSTDIWSSAVVLFGLCGVLAGETTRHALAEAGRRRGRPGRGGDRDLGQPEARQEVGRRSAGQRAARACTIRSLAAARQVPGVEDVTRLRLRRSGPEIFADVTLAVGRGAAFERAHDIAHEVEAAVARRLAERRRGGSRRARSRPARRTSPRSSACWPRGTASAPTAFASTRRTGSGGSNCTWR